MRSIGIIQPGRIGDIIICLPIAYDFIDKGYEVYWPVPSVYYAMVQPAFPGLTWLPMENDLMMATRTARTLTEHCDDILNLAFGFFGEECFTRHTNKRFDEYKYELAGLPIETKWNGLRWADDFWPKIGTPPENAPYYAIHDVGSDGGARTVEAYKALGDDLGMKISPVTDNAFDWREVIKNADGVIMLDSCFANLVDVCGWQYEGVRCLSKITPIS